MNIHAQTVAGGAISMIRIASYNVENLFSRPKVFDLSDWDVSEPVLKAYEKLSALLQKPRYSAKDKLRIRDLLLELDIYTVDKKTKAIRRNKTTDPQWAWLRKNRGTFDREPRDRKQDVEIVADGRGDWIGWVELAKEAVDETATRMTARVIQDIDADILGLVEVEDRPALLRFNRDLLGGLYGHVMLVDGNDDRGIDVAIMTRDTCEIESIRSNVDKTDAQGIIFSRDCAEYRVRTPNGMVIHVLVNHFKSQSGGGGEKRERQAKKVREIVDELVQAGAHVVVVGDLNEGPAGAGTQAPNLARLFKNKSPLIDCYSLPGFDLGNRPGTFDSCTLRNRLDYIFISKSLKPHYTAGRVFRKGLWGSRVKRPALWETYPEITASREGASDHSAVVIELNI
jgi:endonuclease/exonuclease/phosphatase family metal-dependent hydrolase